MSLSLLEKHGYIQIVTPLPPSIVKTSPFLTNVNRHLRKIILKHIVSKMEGCRTIKMFVLLIERRLLKRLSISKTEDMESVGENEAFPTPEISIEVPLATWIDLIGEGIRESSKEDWLVIWSMAPESITQVLGAIEIKAKQELPFWEDNRETWEAKARGVALVRATWVDFLLFLSACLSLYHFE